jgi:N-acetylmuramic acid 6-phosphate etherase
VSEEPHANAAGLDSLATIDLLELINAEDQRAVAAVKAQLPAVAQAVDAIASRLRSGGRLHYFGAGTSGRLAALDAAECAPTFGIDPDLVQARSAGDGAAEDDRGLGAAHARAAGLTSEDAIVAISASGSTAYVLGAVDVAREAGALVVGLSCAPGTAVGKSADIAIEVDAGPEVIAGSTRLKAGTAQKVVLNMISTAAFTRLGRTYRGRMVGVVAANAKLRARALRLVVDLTGAPASEAERVLEESHGDARVAILVLRCGLPAVEAESRLAAARGDLAAAMGERSS